MKRRIWSDDIRKRLEVEDRQIPRDPEPPRDHWHIWVERGWSGTLSPRLATMDDVQQEFRDLMAELGGPEVRGSAHFPFSQVFVMIPSSKNQMGSLNVTLKECKAGRLKSGSRDCNRLGEWR